MKGISAILAAGTLALVGRVTAAPSEPPMRTVEKRADPSVAIASGTIVGKTRINTEVFNGIPYALPPTGDRRLRPPVRLNSTIGTFDASAPASACPQFLSNTAGNDLISQVLTYVTGTPLFQDGILRVSEDCLTVNVIRPAGTKAGDKLPVLFWIFGGGFEVSCEVLPRK